MVTKTLRRQRVRELLAHNQIASQEQLQAMLEHAGVLATQATLSRDLRDLGVLKGPGGYRLPDSTLIVTNGSHQLDRMLPAQLLSVEIGGNLIVLKTMPGHANPLALEIDRASLPGVLGTIAGDDTVFVAAKSKAHALRLLKRIRMMAGWSEANSPSSRF